MFKRLSIISNEIAKAAPAVISSVPAIVSLPVTAPVVSKMVTTKKPVTVKTVPTKKIAKKKKKIKLINESPAVK
jgi:lipoprotein-anchoring transpeptidase ErfK/SrfK